MNYWLCIKNPLFTYFDKLIYNAIIIVIKGIA